MFELTNFDQHERVLHINDAVSGLRAIIAIHSTALGPAGGGCRVWDYRASHDALADALNLSRGMSYKNALAGLKMGGGKAVILGPIPVDRRKTVFEALGRAVNSLSGDYVTAEDVGVGVADMEAVSLHTAHVSGLSNRNGAGGDPSPFTAKGVRLAMEAVANHSLGSSSLEGLTVAVQGLGAVGRNLCKELAERGAKLIVADIDLARVDEVCSAFGAKKTSVDQILLEDADIVAPCALGGALSESVVNKLRAKAVVGGANNQLATAGIGKLLLDRGISYVPDYLANAGGIIMVAAEYFGANTTMSVHADVDKIYDRAVDVLRRSKELAKPTSQVADEMALAIIEKATKGVSTPSPT